MKSIQLTTEEKQLIVEALLFSSITDICAEWTPKQDKLMIELAKKIDNVYLFEGGVLDNPKLAEQTKEAFPNLPRNSIIVD